MGINWCDTLSHQESTHGIVVISHFLRKLSCRKHIAALAVLDHLVMTTLAKPHNIIQHHLSCHGSSMSSLHTCLHQRCMKSLITVIFFSNETSVVGI